MNFLRLTKYDNEETVYINFGQVISFKEAVYSKGKGTVLNMAGGVEIVKETPEEVYHILYQNSLTID